MTIWQKKVFEGSSTTVEGNSEPAVISFAAAE